MKKLEYIWLSNLDISNETKFKLIKLFDGVENLFNCSFDDLVCFGVKDEITYKILDKKTKEKALYDEEYMDKNNISIISFDEEEYPDRLLKLNDKPVSIFVKGNKNILNNKGIGIVGSRLALKESLEISRLVANAFCHIGENVISGLAVGIDKYAHLGALDSNRKRKNNRNYSKSD